MRLFAYTKWIVPLFLPLLWQCGTQDEPDTGEQSAPEGFIEVRPVLPRIFRSIPRIPSDSRHTATRKYDPHSDTETWLNQVGTIRLPEGSTVWLIAKNPNDNSFVKNSYVVYNSDDTSYLVPCTVDDNGKIKDMEGKPLYLKEGMTYMFYAVSPARKLDEAMLSEGKIGFQVKNGENFYANDCRYNETTPIAIPVTSSSSNEAVQEITLSPMINQTAELKFQIKKGHGVHNLDIQPAGIQISGLQNDSPNDLNDDKTPNPYGNHNGLYWHMSQDKNDEPIDLQHGDKEGIYYDYDYRIDANGDVNIEVPVLPMWSISKPVIVVFRLKINGVPTSYAIMLNEKDFKAGYSYGYKGEVAIHNGIDVITWQYVAWETDVEFPFD